MKLASILATVASVATVATVVDALDKNLKVDLYESIVGTDCSGEVVVHEYHFKPSNKCEAEKCGVYEGDKFSVVTECGVGFLDNLGRVVDKPKTDVLTLELYSGSKCAESDIKYAIAVVPDGKCYPTIGTIEDNDGNNMHWIKATKGDSGYTVMYYPGEDALCKSGGKKLQLSTKDIDTDGCIDKQFIAYLYKPGDFAGSGDATTAPTSKVPATTEPSTTSAPNTTAPSTTEPAAAPVPAPSAANSMAIVSAAAIAITGAVMVNSLL